MTFRVSLYLLLLCAQSILGLPTPDPTFNNPHNQVWTRESVLTLVGVVVSFLCFILGLAWPAILELTRNIRSSECKLQRYQLLGKSLPGLVDLTLVSSDIRSKIESASEALQACIHHAYEAIQTRIKHVREAIQSSVQAACNTFGN